MRRRECRHSGSTRRKLHAIGDWLASGPMLPAYCSGAAIYAAWLRARGTTAAERRGGSRHARR